MKAAIKISILAILICINGCVSFGTKQQINHRVEKRNDGGYTLKITGNITQMNPANAEGSLPRQEVHYVIDLKGEGKDWSYRNQPGFYYSFPDTIECRPYFSRDFGYAWVDTNKEYIYI
jgi:hypothetical protein